MPLDQNPHQTVTHLGCVGFPECACRFSMPQIRQFALFTYPPRSVSSASWFPLSEAKTHWTVNWLQRLNQLEFVLRHTKIFMQNSSEWCLWNVQLLRSTVNRCWSRFKHTFYHISNIHGCMHCFWLSRLWFIYEDASFFHFLHKITNMRSWRCFSFSKIRTQFLRTFCNITMIFKVMSHHFPALFRRIYHHIRLAKG